MPYSPPLGPWTPLALVSVMPAGIAGASFSTPALQDWIQRSLGARSLSRLRSMLPESSRTSVSRSDASRRAGSSPCTISTRDSKPGNFLAAARIRASVTNCDSTMELLCVTCTRGFCCLAPVLAMLPPIGTSGDLRHLFADARGR